MLAEKHPFLGDDDILFDEPTHKYTVRGKKVPISVTALCAQALPPEHRFDGRTIIKKNLVRPPFLARRLRFSRKRPVFLSAVKSVTALLNKKKTYTSAQRLRRLPRRP